MKNYMKVTFLSKNENVIFSRTVAVGFLVNLNLEISILNEIKTAISEAVTNAIVHGYENMKGVVRIICRIVGNEFELQVADDGVGIEDIGQAMQPLFTSKPDCERSGMGFTVMQTFMDELSVESTPGEGTVVTMRKRIRG